MQLYPKLILDALAKVRYPGNGKDLVDCWSLIVQKMMRMARQDGCVNVIVEMKR